MGGLPSLKSAENLRLSAQLPKGLYFHHGGDSHSFRGEMEVRATHLACSDGTHMRVWVEWGSHLSEARAKV